MASDLASRHLRNCTGQNLGWVEPLFGQSVGRIPRSINVRCRSFFFSRKKASSFKTKDVSPARVQIL